jgi:hypothetical protein
MLYFILQQCSNLGLFQYSFEPLICPDFQFLMNLQVDPNAGLACDVHSEGRLEPFVQDFNLIIVFKFIRLGGCTRLPLRVR